MPKVAQNYDTFTTAPVRDETSPPWHRRCKFLKLDSTDLRCEACTTFGGSLQRLHKFILYLTITAAAICAFVIATNRSHSVSRGPRSLPGSLIEEKPDRRLNYRRPELIPYPKANPYSDAKYDLGKALFFDPRLSRSNQMACVSCHHPQRDWADGLARGLGEGHKELSRRVPTIINVAWGKSFFWDGRATTLEEQALGPIQSEAEMNMTLPELIKKLNTITEYGPLFERAFPGSPISPETIGKAIATFERTIVTDIAPFDVWVAGDESAVSEAAKRGFALFNGKAACVKCHNGWNFTNGSFVDIGLDTQDRGRGKIAGNSAVDFAFKTPTLRNVSRRTHFMHDGSLKTLDEVIENYNVGGTVKRKVSQMFLKSLGLTPQEKQDLISFLETLTSKDEVVVAPSLPGKGQEETWSKLSFAR